MHLIVCVDDRDGMSFAGRRLSRDREVIHHILKLTEGKQLWMNTYSAKLFPADSVYVADDFLGSAGAGEYCFLETTPIPEVIPNLESVILYRWNRRYPSTDRFPRALLDHMHPELTEEFPGYSHERITMERFVP